MNERLKQLMLEAGYAAPELAGRALKLAELIVKECDSQNRRLSYDLLGVIIDVNDGDTGFDDVCFNTVKRVHTSLATGDLKKHFGVEE